MRARSKTFVSGTATGVSKQIEDHFRCNEDFSPKEISVSMVYVWQTCEFRAIVVWLD